ncbi:SRPBCC family protein, partial [Gemmatimonadota bacterium]
GDLDSFEGEWTFTPVEEGTDVVLTVHFDFGLPNMEELIGPTLELKVRENSEMMLEALKGHFEGGDSWKSRERGEA